MLLMYGRAPRAEHEDTCQEGEIGSAVHAAPAGGERQLLYLLTPDVEYAMLSHSK
jgi:hypothetical protein